MVPKHTAPTCELNEIISAKTRTRLREGTGILTITIITKSVHTSSHIFTLVKVCVIFFIFKNILLVCF